jgi:hypothetical protein
LTLLSLAKATSSELIVTTQLFEEKQQAILIHKKKQQKLKKNITGQGLGCLHTEVAWIQWRNQRGGEGGDRPPLGPKKLFLDCINSVII